MIRYERVLCGCEIDSGSTDEPTQAEKWVVL